MVVTPPIANSNKDSRNSLTSSHLLAENAAWSLLGQVLPLAVGAAVIPTLMRGLGTARFGIFTLGLAVIGYSGLFDLGLGRALTKLVAEKLGRKEEEQLPRLIWTALSLMFGTGLLGTGACWFLSPWLVRSGLAIPSALRPEALLSFRIIALSIPIVIASTGLRGILEAQQEFGYVNFIRVPMGILTFLGPWVVLFLSKSLAASILSLVFARVVCAAVGLLLITRTVPRLWRRAEFTGSDIRPLIAFGSWMTVSNVIGPLMVYLDRFIIGALIGMSAVAYYATPFEVVTKQWVIPASLASVLFPAFSSLVDDAARIARLLERGVSYVLMVLFPLTLIFMSFSREGLKLWLGADFSQHSGTVLQLLAVGVFVNSLAQIAFCCVQALGRPDLTAKAHAFETPIYILLLWTLIVHYGINGAAIAWLLRSIGDAVVQFGFALRLLPQTSALAKSLLLRIGPAFASFAIAAYLNDFNAKVLFVLATLVAFVFVAWFGILGKSERLFLISRLKRNSLVETVSQI